MQKKQYQRWQVILGVIGFLLVMGVVGKMDQDSKQATVAAYELYAKGK